MKDKINEDLYNELKVMMKTEIQKKERLYNLYMHQPSRNSRNPMRITKRITSQDQTKTNYLNKTNTNLKQTSTSLDLRNGAKALNSGKVTPSKTVKTSFNFPNTNEKVALKSSIYKEYKNLTRAKTKDSSYFASKNSMVKKNTYSHSFFNMTNKVKQQESERLLKQNVNSSTNSLKQDKTSNYNRTYSKMMSKANSKQEQDYENDEINLPRKLDDCVVKQNDEVPGYQNAPDNDFKIKLENNEIFEISYEEQKPSESSRISTKKSDTSNKNIFQKDCLLPVKVNKKNIMYTNEINLEEADENFKSILFRKKY